MKMIVSDYDGTIKRFTGTPSIIDKIDLKKDINEINKFIKEGNKFVIATKRITISMLKEIKKYNINYNYLITHEGLTNYDMYGNLLYANYLEKDLIKYIKELKEKTDILENIDYYNAFGDTLNKDKYILISLKIKDIKETIKHLKSLEQTIENLYYSYDYKTQKIWLHNKTNKNTGISNLLDNIPDKIQDKNIITVGDSNHDTLMVKEHNGYCIKNSELDIYSTEINNTVPNIRKLIKKIK